MYERLLNNIPDTKTDLLGDSYNDDTGFVSNGNNFHNILILIFVNIFWILPVIDNQ